MPAGDMLRREEDPVNELKIWEASVSHGASQLIIMTLTAGSDVD